MAKKENAIATVLAFEKKLVPSDGYLYGTTWDNRSSELALKVVEKSVRGTISNRMKNTSDKDMLKLNNDIENANPQTVDSCALGEHQDTLKVSFTLKVLGNVERPSACNNEFFLASYQNVAKAYKTKYGFKELANRYAQNIANARFLWRNRVGSEKIEIVVKSNDGQTWQFDALQFPLNKFDTQDTSIQSLADIIAKALSGELPYLLITVEAFALVGKGQEVYPSEELVLDKGKGSKSKILYQVNNVAAMHSQKVGNAIRSIDTWYPEFENKQMAIAIEPYGAVTNLGKAYRTPKDKIDFYTLFDKYAMGETLETPEQEHYVMAVLVRGGVFGQSGKD